MQEIDNCGESSFLLASSTYIEAALYVKLNIRLVAIIKLLFFHLTHHNQLKNFDMVILEFKLVQSSQQLRLIDYCLPFFI